ncbi:MAG: Do family serine endopeptidase [Deltaproteobacteria bacterium]|jgi:serine protease Do|nr:Do family serine endopeptidase [Deltaproteobacteria bacterium]MBT4090537.1 Do family serine endopeptidase [Deltaproteobacteria bacterium]MBT4268168.1 Do family serine endopeptidase [Deltaproteobacteria bacterium]MBT4640203.1 Do family serine endopeptidase [Deltaproteobacteria bacterium]MBT6612041.1 Do family serine endopeptidase [Deltaproteobacteria bacterium]
MTTNPPIPFKKILAVVLLTLFVSQPALARPGSFSPIVKSEKEKIVNISSSAVIEHSKLRKDPLFEQFFKNMPKKQRQSSLGSGFIISHDGYIVTNHHVIAKAEKIEVKLFDGRTFNAKIIGKDKLSELALIKIEAKKLPFIKWGDSDAIEVGDWVLAIGNPLGFDHTVTAGIISARGRSVFGSTAYGQFLQTDAAINFGNSGGPLFNLDAEVIGINTAIVAGGQNLGFAIPSKLAQKVIRQLRKNGKVARGWFGVEIQEVDNELAESFGLPSGMRGVVLTGIGKGSPAEKAGLAMGDVIVEFNGNPLNKTTQLQQYVGETTPGSDVRVKIFRNGKFLDKTVTVNLRPAEGITSLDNAHAMFGMQLAELTPEIKAESGLTEKYGILVIGIDQAGIAWEKGIRKNDIILKANNHELETIDDFFKVVRLAKKGTRPISLLISRKGRSIFVPLPIK